MLFNSREFLVFLVVLLGAYALAGRAGARGRTRRLILLTGSLVFYGYWYPPYLILLVVCVLVNWGTIHALDRAGHRSRLAWWIIFGNIVYNLGVLAVYKYTGFVLRTLNWTFLEVGLRGELPVIDFALPLGVSFFTLQMLAYSIDVYRQGFLDREARGLVPYAMFVTFFPQLIAGPIVRGREILKQIDRPRQMSVEGVYWGLLIFLWGLFKKAVLSDRLTPFVVSVYTDPEGLHWAGQWVAVYCFAFQIYCDFSGYSDMAIGLGKMMGYEIPLNFKEPYLSPSITVFWRRWHITLSSWLRDYLYIPLGGNRKGEAMTYRNLLLTMLLGGLWHGAGWVFVVWGGLHGVYLAAHKLWSRWVEHRGTQALATVADQEQRMRPREEEKPDAWGSPMYWVKCAVTFHLVCITWVFFRAGLNDATAVHSQWETAMIVIRRMLTFAGGDFWAEAYDVLPFLALASLLHIAERFVRHHGWKLALRAWERIPVLGQAAAVAGFLVAMVILGGEQAQFIYFAF